MNPEPKELQSKITLLQRKNAELFMMAEVVQSFANAQTTEQIINKLLEFCAEITGAQEVYFLSNKEESKKFEAGICETLDLGTYDCIVSKVKNSMNELNNYNSVHLSEKPKRSVVMVNLPLPENIAEYVEIVSKIKDPFVLALKEKEHSEKLKESENALRESEQLYRTVFDNNQDGFQLIELIFKNAKPIDHKFLKVNHAYESIIGVKADDILGKTARFISPNVEPHWLDVPDRVAKTGLSEHVELYNKDIGKWLDCFYFLYSKNVIGTIFRDITERKKLEKQLQDSERLAAIGATAGMVGHDIRNPLQAITSDLYLAKEGLDSCLDSDGKKDALESLIEIEKNIEYINKIVQDLQDYARPLNPKSEEIDLKLIIAGLLSKQSTPENIELSVKIENKAEKINADSYYINRIMTNLITNAVQAMPNGGKLTIHALRDPKDLVMTVTDTGVGIPKDIQGKMFTLLFTTKAKGQGFGLPVIKRMTESLGGTVTFESQEGKGTTFTVRLPLNRLS